MTPYQHILFRKHVAYRQCFMGENGELTPAAKIVLADLAKFGNVTGGPAVVSPVSRTTDVPATMQRVGRAEAFFRVWRFLRLPINQLFQVEEMRDE